MKETGFHGKVIYNPSGKAGEYSYWAANFYNGCSARCEYCYNRKGRGVNIMGGDMPTLKKSLVNEDIALGIFTKELLLNANAIRPYGLFFNFVSDPCLPETFELNNAAWDVCYYNSIPVKILTKQTWWIDHFEGDSYMSIGFTLTGHDELEPGAAPNQERIKAMKNLHNAGFKTWASIEPIIDIPSSLEMIKQTVGFCDLYKIGLQSGKKYFQPCLQEFINEVHKLVGNTPVYWKDSLLLQAGIRREDLPENCVTRDFNL